MAFTKFEKELLLNLFVKDGLAYSLNPFGEDRVEERKVEEKVFHEIESTVINLASGDPIVPNLNYLTIRSAEGPKLPIFIYRTICMLLGLRIFLKNQDLNFLKLLKDQSDISIDIMYDIKRGKLIETDSPQKWTLSYALLLVQAIKFSQLEWDNNDYCFEYFSAIRASNEVDSLFEKLSYQKNEQAFLSITHKLRRLIRWQTLNGQFKRGTANFSTRNPNLGILVEEERKMHIALAFSDDVLRVNSYSNEIAIRNIIKKGELDRLIDENLLYVETIKPQTYEQNLFLNHEEDYSTALNIFSYLRLSNKELGEFNNSLRKWLSSKYNVEDCSHFIIDRTQREKGVLKKLGEEFKGGIGPHQFEEYFFLKEPELLSETGDTKGIVPKEHIYLVYIKPLKILELIHGFFFKPGEDPASAVQFLQIAFEAAINKFDGTLPLPIIEKILNLLPFYNAKAPKKRREERHLEAFQARIVFDRKQKLEFWLPEIINKKQSLEEKHDRIEISKGYQVSIKEILERFLHYSITNYGMTEQYSHVDIDLSAASNSSNLFWKTAFLESRKKYGIHVFGRYLEDCGANIIRSTFSLDSYERSLDPRKLVNPYQILLNEVVPIKESNRIKEQIEVEINGKYILGIDIGGTGIKMRFFKINNLKTVRNIPPVVKDDDFLLLRLKEQDSQSIPYYLVWDGKEYTIPTARKDGLYKDSNDFARYIIGALKSQIDVEKWDELSKDLISIGVCWPGPIKQNMVASTSGILQKFEGFEGSILGNSRSKILELNIGKGVKEVFNKEFERDISVALSNDGDVEAAGIAFGIINQVKYSRNNQFKQDGTKISGRELAKRLIESHRVAVIKAGTGTAGAILNDGKLSGLNEFGKVIVDLVADNRENEIKAQNNNEGTWPQGDANKFFSLQFIRQEAQKAGVPVEYVGSLGGRDIDLMFRNQNSLIHSFDKRRHILYGVLELIEIGKPKVKWDNLIDHKQQLKKRISLSCLEDEGILIKKGESAAKIDEDTWQNLSKIKDIQNLIFAAEAPVSLESLLTILGKVRIARLNLNKVISNQSSRAVISDMGKNMGKKLANIIGLLNQIRNLKLVIVGGGPMKSEPLGMGVDVGLKESVPSYFHNRFFDKFENLDLHKADYRKRDSDSKQKVFYYRQGSDFAILGAAMLGFDFFVKEKKISELQQVARMKEGVVYESMVFLQIQEAENFIKREGPRLRITYDLITKEISSVD